MCKIICVIRVIRSSPFTRRINRSFKIFSSPIPTEEITEEQKKWLEENAVLIHSNIVHTREYITFLLVLLINFTARSSSELGALFGV